MKLKPLVILSSLLMLITLIVYVSVYAYNAYAYASQSGGGAGCNGWGLIDGTYSAMIKIGGKIPEPRHEHHKHGPYADGNEVSEGVSAGNPNNKKVYAEGYISGVDPQAGEFRSMTGLDEWP